MSGFQATIPQDSLSVISDLANGRPKAGDGSAKMYWKSIDVGAGTSAEVDSLFDLPAKALVYDVLVEVTTAEATGSTKTLDVGLLSGESGGDADGFLDGIDVSATGMKQGGFTVTDGSNQNYVSARTMGAFMFQGLVGANAAGESGVVIPRKHLAAGVTAKSVSYSRGDTFVEFVGKIWLLIAEF